MEVAVAENVSDLADSVKVEELKFEFLFVINQTSPEEEFLA